MIFSDGCEMSIPCKHTMLLYGIFMKFGTLYKSDDGLRKLVT